MNIEINTGSSVQNVELKKGESLLDAINKAGIDGFDAPCGGKGTCGKCRIIIENPPLPTDSEIKFLSAKEIDNGVRLACRVFPDDNMIVFLDSGDKKAVIQSSFIGDISQLVISDEPVCKKQYVELDPPEINDQRSDYKRLSCSLFSDGFDEGFKLPLGKKRLLPSLLRDNDFKLTITSILNEYTDIAGGNSSNKSYAVAVDIGTTTVVAYLVVIAGDNRGTVLDLVSGLNSQKGYGGDVISRIEYCMQDDANLNELQQRITEQISEMVKDLTVRNNISIDFVDLITIAGNTSMTHLFSGLDPRGIATAPFIPVDTGLIIGPAEEFGLKYTKGCGCLVLPGIASYVGADITSGIVATGMHESGELSLLIDIGTNGEIVLGNKEGLTACSTAAGPALEGANISCGMGGITGAINCLNTAEPGESEMFSYSVIGNTDPVGMCGSGIVDAVALFVKSGVIDETGRILNEAELSEAGVSQGWIKNVIKKDGNPALRITENISITQKDIREIQMAKAAIAAGVKTLLAETGRTLSDVKKLFIAGGFGAAMDKRSAAVVGLFPSELEKFVVIAGNTAGKGAILSSLSKKVLDDIERVAMDVNYIELSTSALFQQEYMMAMYF